MQRAAARAGFTMIEMLIVVSLLSLLLIMAASGYSQYALRAHRIDATTTLLRIQVAQEQFFLRNNRYAGVADMAVPPPDGLGLLLTDGGETQGGRYTITLLSPTDTTYQVRADAAGAQTRDTNCLYFTIDQRGYRTPDPASGCWR